MNAKEFREFGYAAIDFVADYMENVHDRLKNIHFQFVAIKVFRSFFHTKND